MIRLFSKTFLFCALLSIFKSNAQLDTLSYLKQFEANKTKYICQPFSKLLADMKVAKPKMVWKEPLYHGTRKYEDVTIFCFNEKYPVDYENRRIIPTAKCLKIEWDQYIYVRVSDSNYYLLLKENKNNFNNDVITFFNSIIMKDIEVYK